MKKIETKNFESSSSSGVTWIKVFVIILKNQDLLKSAQNQIIVLGQLVKAVSSQLTSGYQVQDYILQSWDLERTPVIFSFSCSSLSPLTLLSSRIPVPHKFYSLDPLPLRFFWGRAVTLSPIMPINQNSLRGL